VTDPGYSDPFPVKLILFIDVVSKIVSKIEEIVFLLVLLRGIPILVAEDVKRKNQMVQVLVALGSNIGNRDAYMAAALQCLLKLNHEQWKQSRVYETDPLGASGQEKYLNQVVSFYTELSAVELLEYLKGVEVLLGRRNRGHWNSREIDLDLLYYGDYCCQTEYLQLPHPHRHLRSFVLVPAAEIDPDFWDPEFNCSLQKLREALPHTRDLQEYDTASTIASQIEEPVL